MFPEDLGEKFLLAFFILTKVEAAQVPISKGFGKQTTRRMSVKPRVVCQTKREMPHASIYVKC